MVFNLVKFFLTCKIRKSFKKLSDLAVKRCLVVIISNSIVSQEKKGNQKKAKKLLERK